MTAHDMLLFVRCKDGHCYVIIVNVPGEIRGANVVQMPPPRTADDIFVVIYIRAGEDVEDRYNVVARDSTMIRRTPVALPRTNYQTSKKKKKMFNCAAGARVIIMCI